MTQSEQLPARPVPAPDPSADTAGTRPPGRSRALTVLAAVAVALFALWGLAGPLAGRSVLASTDEMVAHSPYAEAGFAGSTTRNTYLDDIYTSTLPGMVLVHDTLASGGLPEWNPYQSGGAPFAVLPGAALFNPLSLPFWVLPPWLAPAYERLLEILCAVGGCFLYLRRMRLGRPAAVLGGLAYAGSAFMVVWLGFPHTRVAAFIPALFWTLERYLQRRRAGDAALVALPVAAMLLGGFPAVTGYALLTAGCYTLARAFAGSGPLRALAAVGGAALGVAAGVGLALFQVLPFAQFFGTFLIEGREQGPADHLDPASLVTGVSPFALGTVDPASRPGFILARNLVESMSYAGAAVTVLALVAVATARRGRALLPRGGWLALVVAAGVWAELIWFGGPPLGLLQRVPGIDLVFGGNFIGRARSILGFLVAVLAAVGFDLLLRRRRAAAPRPALDPGRLWAVTFWVAAVAVAGYAVTRARHHATVAGTLGSLDHHLAVGALLTALAGLAALGLWLAGGPRRATRIVRVAAAVGLLALVAGQATAFARDWYPTSPRSTFYPVTDTHRFLAANLGGQRFASADHAMVFGTSSAYRLRALNGHEFLNASFAAMVRGIPGDPIPYPTYLDLTADAAQATSPILDRLGTRYFVTALADPVFGARSDDPGDGGTVTLSPGSPVRIPLPGGAPLRAVGVRPAGAVPPQLTRADPDSRVEVVIQDANGRFVARTSRLTAGMRTGATLLVPVAAEDTPAGVPLTATLTLHTPVPLTVAARSGAPAVTTVAGTDDGLRLVHVGTSAIYERLHALPRVRWAAGARVLSGERDRVAALAAGRVPDDTVLLSAPGPAASGAPAQVRVDEDGTGSVTATVRAGGSGYLVVADADQVGWVATVDGRAAPLVAADQGVVAVAVPAGEHVVGLRFAPPRHTAAVLASLATALLLAAVWVGGLLRRRRDPAGHRDGPRDPDRARNPDGPRDPDGARNPDGPPDGTRNPDGAGHPDGTPA